MGTENKEKVILATLTGVASGVILGLLFAPEKGEDTRKKISAKRAEYLKDIKAELEELRESLNESVESGKEEMSELGQEFKKKGDDILEKAKKLSSYEEWTKDELYEKAKQLKIDGYSKMNKEGLINALRNR